MPRGVRASNKSVLRNARLKLGLSQAKLAELAGINQKTVSRAERGDTVPMDAHLAALGLDAPSKEEPEMSEKEAPVAPKAKHKPAKKAKTKAKAKPKPTQVLEHEPLTTQRIPMHHSHEYYQVMELLHFIDDDELAQLAVVVEKLRTK